MYFLDELHKLSDSDREDTILLKPFEAHYGVEEEDYRLLTLLYTPK